MKVLDLLRKDISAALERDPAARNRYEVVLFYPGFHAVAAYRLAHQLWQGGNHLGARTISALAYRWTGVDIHPGATIGSGFFIDHASGVVIGETAVVGDDVTMYHQVTLGGRGDQTGKRHPDIEDRVVLGAGAKVLGPIRVGHDSRIGANAVVVRDVPPGSVVVGVPGQVISRASRFEGTPLSNLEMPDAIGDGLKSLIDRVDEIAATVGQPSKKDIRPRRDGIWSYEDFSI